MRFFAIKCVVLHDSFEFVSSTFFGRSLRKANPIENLLTKMGPYQCKETQKLDSPLFQTKWSNSPKVCPHTQTHMKIQIINKSHHPLPSYATALSAGMDLRANISSSVTLKPLERYLVPTGIYIALPAGYEGQVRPRSGLATKRGITVVNAPGTIDADYRGELRVSLVNLSTEDFIIEDGERIAQLVVARHETVEWEETDSLDETARGTGGWGSTGSK